MLLPFQHIIFGELGQMDSYTFESVLKITNYKSMSFS